jgi:hypothetical protein
MFISPDVIKEIYKCSNMIVYKLKNGEWFSEYPIDSKQETLNRLYNQRTGQAGRQNWLYPMCFNATKRTEDILKMKAIEDSYFVPWFKEEGVKQ